MAITNAIDFRSVVSWIPTMFKTEANAGRAKKKNPFHELKSNPYNKNKIFNIFMGDD